MGKIILKCVEEKRKLRIKFHCYINDEGKEYRNVYNNLYNCRFPKNIRVDGKHYEIDERDLTTVAMSGKAPFYRISSKAIKILENYNVTPPDLKNDVESMRIFAVDECVICLCELPTSIFIPCGHQVCCKACTSMLSKKSDSNKCPICRANIVNIYEP